MFLIVVVIKFALWFALHLAFVTFQFHFCSLSSFACILIPGITAFPRIMFEAFISKLFLDKGRNRENREEKHNREKCCYTKSFWHIYNLSVHKNS